MPRKKKRPPVRLLPVQRAAMISSILTHRWENMSEKERLKFYKDNQKSMFLWIPDIEINDEFEAIFGEQEI